MNTREFTSFSVIEKNISKEKGDVCLFSLLQPKDEDYWDLVIGADWVTIRKIEDIKFVGSLLDTHLSKGLNKQISTIVLLHSSEVFVRSFLNVIMQNNSSDKLLDFEINGARVEQAYIFKPYPIEKNASDDENILNNFLSLLSNVQPNDRDNFLNIFSSWGNREQNDFVKTTLDIPSLEKQIAKIKQLSNDSSEEIIKTPTVNYSYRASDNTKLKQAA